MSRYWLMGAAALLMVPGMALAQGVSTQSTTTTTTTPPPPAGNYSASESQKTVDAYGNTTEKHRSYEQNAEGTDVHSKSETQSPNGTTVSREHERHVNPETGESSSSTTTDVSR